MLALLLQQHCSTPCSNPIVDIVNVDMQAIKGTVLMSAELEGMPRPKHAVCRSAPRALLCTALLCRFNAFQEQKVPGNWGKAPTGLRNDSSSREFGVITPGQVAYPCLKPLNSWVWCRVKPVVCGYCHQVLQSTHSCPTEAIVVQKSVLRGCSRHVLKSSPPEKLPEHLTPRHHGYASLLTG